jgi:hypothetical protein
MSSGRMRTRRVVGLRRSSSRAGRCFGTELVRSLHAKIHIFDNVSCLHNIRSLRTARIDPPSYRALIKDLFIECVLRLISALIPQLPWVHTGGLQGRTSGTGSPIRVRAIASQCSPRHLPEAPCFAVGFDQSCQNDSACL